MQLFFHLFFCFVFSFWLFHTPIHAYKHLLLRLITYASYLPSLSSLPLPHAFLLLPPPSLPLKVTWSKTASSVYLNWAVTFPVSLNSSPSWRWWSVGWVTGRGGCLAATCVLTSKVCNGYGAVYVWMYRVCMCYECPRYVYGGFGCRGREWDRERKIKLVRWISYLFLYVFVYVLFLIYRNTYICT